MNINTVETATNAFSPLAKSANTKTSDKDVFMTLLVAQLKNQDPLAPQDGTQFVAQLAQFNSLDQLIGIRNSIEKVSAALQQGEQPQTQVN